MKEIYKYVLQASSNFDDIFEVFLRQIEVDEYPPMTPDGLRNCVQDYCQKEKERLQVCVSMDI